jgi:NAD(P)-dependent dehydrogenase (short-subunit alcohol dehydrogenase family)
MALLTGKTAVITGGSSGIGLATARRFIDEGATVFVTGPNRAELEMAAAILGPAAVPVQGRRIQPDLIHHHAVAHM